MLTCWGERADDDIGRRRSQPPRFMCAQGAGQPGMTTATFIAGLTLVLAVASVTLNHLRLRRRIARETMSVAAPTVEPAPWEKEGGRDLTAPPPEAVALQASPEPIATGEGSYPPEATRPPEPGSLLAAAAPLPLRMPSGCVARRPDPARAAPPVLRRDLTRALDRIPPLPPGTHEILRDLAYPGLAARTLSAVVATEPFVRASLLRGANAVLADAHDPVATGEEAIQCLGVATTRSLVLRLKVAMSLRDGAVASATAKDAPHHASAAEHLWSHALAVAAAAEHLARRAGGTDPALAATIGLLHDVGKLAVLRVAASRVPAHSGAARDAADDEGSLACERRAYGGDHAAIGAYLAARWQLPQDVTEGIRRHHLAAHQAVRSLPTPLRRALLVVHVANQLVKYEHAYAPGVEIDPLSPVLLAELGLPAEAERVMDESLLKVIGRALTVANAAAPVRASRALARAG
jgi:putative nucleotidyltransferase with HDIG domain